MFPSNGPKKNSSYYAEPGFYNILKKSLSDEYTVIHSLPWLCSAMVEIYNDPSFIGEIDFLIIHPSKGVLAVEVKGGSFSRDCDGYYYVKGETKSHFDPYNQLNRGVFALQEILKKQGMKERIGRAFYFPETSFGFSLSSEYITEYKGCKLKIVIDADDRGNEVERIIQIMDFYSEFLGFKPRKDNWVDIMINCLLPQGNNAPCWVSRIKDDNRTWLKLTEEQELVASNAVDSDRLLVTGWPGSGKTIVLIHACRKLAKQGKRILVITFNKLLSDKISEELSDIKNCKVFNYHKLIEIIKNKDSCLISGSGSLEEIINEDSFSEFDALFVDEGQAINSKAWELLFSAFQRKKIVVMSDDAQAFCYEDSVSIDFLRVLLQTQPYILTESLRVPKLVCNELKLFMKPYYTVINNRCVDDTTLYKIPTHDQFTALKKLVFRILSDGISMNDICVLKPGYIDLPLGIIHKDVVIESIGRFRGLEKPIVIVFSSENMTNAEFFCAISRATSRCFILLDANFIISGKYYELGRRLMTEMPDDINRIAKKAQMMYRINEWGLPRELVFDGLLTVEWCEKWAVYFIYSKINPVIQELFICYLEVINIKGFVGWNIDALHFLRVSGHENIEFDSRCSESRYELEFCSVCNNLKPHKIPCLTCSSKKRIDLRYDLLEFLKTPLSLIELKREMTPEERFKINPFISASILVNHVNDTSFNVVSLSSIKSSKTYLGLAISIHILYFLFINKDKGAIKVTNKDMIAFFVKCVPSIYENLSINKFSAYVDSAMNNLIDIGVLKKTGKGVCVFNDLVFR